MTEERFSLCIFCNSKIDITPGSQPGRKEECPNCARDLHCCRQCAHYDPLAYNECREPQAERVVDKERANFCDYFSFAKRSHPSKDKGLSPEQEARKKLDELFK